MSGRVLVVDDHSNNRKLLGELLRREGMEVVEAQGGVEALAQVAQQAVDVVVIDMSEPDQEGLDLFRELKSSSQADPVSIIVMAIPEDSDWGVRCLELGADDYLNKPFQPILLTARIRACLENRSLRAREREQSRQLVALREELAAAQRKLTELSFTDPLTGLPNRRFAFDTLSRIWAAAERNKSHLSCLLIDMDHFKRINETLGHECGDQVLQTAAQVIGQSVRACDVLCRLGGEEFLLICPDTDGPSTRVVGERLRKLVAEHLQDRFAQAMTVSLGAAEKSAAMKGYAELVNHAEDALKQAKREGRNRYQLYTPSWGGDACVKSSAS